ncbi:hypothetical protein BJY04DRAFT_229860 [Aspergillus karnatakaensis]|uniref:putative C6 transcription factor (War1) n=1 Tax=Aspergillus karnatakaensis TaxID=1810916 RepID=UPI003CCDA3F5
MEIDPRLHTQREDSEDSADSGRDLLALATFSDYPEPPANSSRGHAAQNSYSHVVYPRDSTLRGSPHLEGDPNDPYSDLKRPRACESCRSLKVRCEPDINNPNEPCKRCAKAGRSCVVTVPTRKRQKKTDSRVTELERKIDVLTASLQASQQASQKIDALLPSNNSAQAASSREENVGRRWLVPGQGSADRSNSTLSQASQAGNKRSFSGEIREAREVREAREARDTSLSTPSLHSNPSPAIETAIDTSAKQWPVPWATPKPSTREPSRGPDIIDKGLVSISVAMDAFTRYVDRMCWYIPMVVFPVDTAMSDVRKNKPVLFHAIIAVAVGPFEASIQNTLLTELYKTIADRVIVKGEKSLDLVQALLVSCAFYTPPENFEEIKFYQLAQLAVSVGMDIGMYRKSASKGKPFNLIRDFVKHAPMPDPDSPEVRRAWLGCYFVSVQTSSALRRPILLRWLPYMDECIEILENSPAALPSDRVMIQWAKLVRIIEEISSRFFADDLGSLSFSEAKFQFTLKAFEKQLEQWKRETSHLDSAIMTQAEAIVNIYLHENAMVLDNPSEDSKTDTDISSHTTAARISALSSALTSIHQAIDTVCSIPVKDLVNIPTVALARTAFAIVALIKLYSIVTAPDSYIGQVINPSVLKVDCYLNKVIAHYTAAGSLPGGVTPGKFSTVLTMLREWFKSRKDQNGALKNDLQVPDKRNLQDSDRNQAAIQANTPLHLLSEVATGDPKNRSSPNNQYTHYQPSTDLPFSQPLPPCISPSQLPSQLPSTTTVAPNPGAPASTEPDIWPAYAPATSTSTTQRQYYQTSPYDQTQTASPNTQSSGPHSAGPGPAGAGATGYPDFTTSAVSGALANTPSADMLMMAPAVASMGLFAPDLGSGLDEQFLSSMGWFGGGGGEMGYFPGMGSWNY